MVDKSSGHGFAQMIGGGRSREIIYIGRGESGFVKVNILAD